MSSAFPKPVPESRTSSSVSGSYSDFDTNEYYHESMCQWEPDYDELIIPLSMYAFNRLSLSDQREQLEEIRRHIVNVNVEESSDFTELFKKLYCSDQTKFLSKFLQKFKRERLTSSFKQLDAEDQQQLIKSMNHLAPEGINLRDPEETEADFRLRRFTQLSRDHTRDVQKLTWKSEDEREQEKDDNGNRESCFFYEFFLGFSIIWFQGQLAGGQDMLIEQLSNGVTGVVIEQRLPDETEEDFKLRRFTELCKKIVDFRVQVKFLDNAQKKLEMWGSDHFSNRATLEQRAYNPAAHNLPIRRRLLIDDAAAHNAPRRIRLHRATVQKGEFDPEWIKIKLPDLQDQAAAATTRGATATTQAGGGRGQGTSTSTVLVLLSLMLISNFFFFWDELC